MTWSLNIENGDLLKSTKRSFSTIKGSDKVIQDISTWLFSELGHNPIDPQYGSVLHFDDDVFIELSDNDNIFVSQDREELLQEELFRIVEVYQEQQYIRIEQELILYNGQHTFSDDEIIESFEIFTERNVDTLVAVIKFLMITGEVKDIELQFGEQ